MFDSRILEVLIATDDHRMLSANAEAWWLVQNDVFVAFETFLTEEARALFLQHLENEDSSWFLSAFEKQPDVPYLTRIAFDLPRGSGTMLRVILTPLQQLTEDYRRLNVTLNTYGAMLSLRDDLYYEYIPETDTIVLCNTRQTRFSDGSMPFPAFRDLIASLCPEEALPALEVWMNHLSGRTPRFRLTVPCNIINEEENIRSVQIRGAVAHHRNDTVSFIGLMHPMQTRSNEENEIQYDALTGTVTRDHIIRLARDRINRLHAEGTAIAILDVDYFKHVNDNYGHQQGDQVLKQIASIMQTEIRDAGMVGRIGGDEFMLLFYHISGETELRAYLRSIKSVVLATEELATVSIGAAVYPDDAPNYDDLFLVADYCLYLAKEKGRNRYIIHTLAKHPALEEIRKIQAEGERNLVKGRDDLPLGEALVQMQFLVRYGKKPALSTLVNEFAARADIPLISLWRRQDKALIAVGGKEKQDVDALKAYLATHDLEELWTPQYLHDGMVIMDTVADLSEGCEEIRLPLMEHDIGSYIYIPFDDTEGVPAALVFALVHRKIFWNQQRYMHYRLFADLVSHCRVNHPDGEE